MNITDALRLFHSGGPITYTGNLIVTSHDPIFSHVFVLTDEYVWEDENNTSYFLSGDPSTGWYIYYLSPGNQKAQTTDFVAGKMPWECTWEGVPETDWSNSEPTVVREIGVPQDPPEPTTDIIVTGAGEAGANATYSLVDSNVTGTDRVWKTANEYYWIYWYTSLSAWAISDAPPEMYGVDLYYISGTDPIGTWEYDMGSSPAPSSDWVYV